MKRILYILAIVGLTACNAKKPEPVKGYATTPNGLADLQKPASAAKTQTSSPATGTQSNLLLNPKHGEPGHDCSIAVGAPLKASARANAAILQPKANIQTVTTQQPTAATTSTPIAAVSSKGQKLNPAHGQPNHRCDIAVGAPLNSKSVQAVATTAPKATVSQRDTTTSQTPVLNEKGQRLNPAHGQPGHKCDVAVGAPLT